MFFPLAIVLVQPQMGENIGAAARAMKNFGLSDLRLVAPRDGWPNAVAESVSAGARDVLDAARIFATTAEAIADLTRVYASTARMRDMPLPTYSSEEAAERIADEQAGGARIGILFGPERTGLTNDDIALSNGILSVPVSDDYPALNLAQAVAIICYACASKSQTVAKPVQAKVASKAIVQHLFDHLEQELDARNFWRVSHKKEAMWRNIRSLFQRAQMSEQEVRTLRGMVRCLTDGHTDDAGI